MKKRYLYAFISLILCFAFLLTSCGEKVVCTDETDVTDNAASAEESSTSEIPDTPPEPEKDYFELHGNPKLPEGTFLGKYLLPTETEHLYDTGLKIKNSGYGEGAGYEVAVNGDMLKIGSWQKNGQTEEVYSLKTGMLVQEAMLGYDGYCATVTEDGDILYVTTDYDNEVTNVFFVSRDGGEHKNIAVIENMDNISFSPDGRYFGAALKDKSFVLYSADGKIIRRTEKIADGTYIRIQALDGGFAVTGDNDGVRYIGNATGEVTEMNIGDVPYISSGKLYYDNRISPSSGICITDAEENEKRFFIPQSDGYEQLTDMAFGYIATSKYVDDGYRFRFYDLRTEKMVKELELPNENFDVDLKFASDGTAVIITSGFGDAEVYIFDLPSFIASGVEGKDVGIISSTEEELAEDIKNIAKEIYENTGVEILYGSEGNDFSISGYVGVAVLDKYEIYSKIKQVRDILYKFPKNMLREAYEGTQKGMKFYLCGTLHGTSSYGLTTAGAVTSTENGYIVIAYDIRENMSINIPHELSHAFDHRITKVGNENGRDMLTEWEQATPVKGAYAYSYPDYYWLTDYTYDGERNEDRIWFIDSYSRTFPTEDRARIFEHLFNSEDMLEEVLVSPHILEKVELYCEMLRYTFPSCASETPFWDDLLPSAELDSAA